MRIYDAPPNRYQWSPVKVAIVTGLSDRRHCELSPQQLQLLASLEVPETWKLLRNFPYLSRTPRQPVSLIHASFSNAYQFLASKYLVLRAAAHWSALFKSTDRLLVLAGSCGYQFIADALRFNSGSTIVNVLALGPVGYQRARVLDAHVVQGDKDWISRAFVSRVDVRLAGVGHMDYWGCDQVGEVVRDWVRRKISESLAPAATCQNID